MIHFLIKLKIIREEVFGTYSNQNEKKAIIISIKGFKLTKKEKKLISEEKPWGLILLKEI